MRFTPVFNCIYYCFFNKTAVDKTTPSGYKVAMSQRIEVFTLSEDGRAKTYEASFVQKVPGVKKVRVVDVYTIEQPVTNAQKLADCLQSFTNPVTQKTHIIEGGKAPANDYWETIGDFDWALEIGYLPGVTDNIGHTASELTALTLDNNRDIYSSRLLLIDGNLSEDDIQTIAADIHNPLIQRAANKNKEQFTSDNGMGTVSYTHLTLPTTSRV